MKHKFWSDDFDMDLLKVFPDITAQLGATVDVPVWTVGNESFGRLNHPCVWHSAVGLAALFWLECPALKRDEHGWFNVDGCVSNEPIVEATWLEVLRDAWPHRYSVCFGGKVIWNSGDVTREFDTIMYDLRGWSKLVHEQELAKVRSFVLRKIMRANMAFASMVEAFRLEHKMDFPYFASGAVPVSE